MNILELRLVRILAIHKLYIETVDIVFIVT